ncbi:hypothetical protein LX16_1111 [Stackebrandtia albiflava]|uniref:Uncharacterized protein n=1 Tax=Stackebrandtia albiflava TaxID=406432 RepID=A0A562VC23_9ACTN|nr:hypothetical protein [Stackebrandtia albiflava]TWJ15408.1 hypothetical protein LX16_1111 [Stackebrandtia albiflava]
MTTRRLDTTALTVRPNGPDWEEFTRAAMNGRHGTDLAVRRMERYRFALLAVVLVVGAPAVPTGLLLTEGVTLLSVSMSLLWVGTILVMALISLKVRRLDHWGPKARRRFRLTGFAAANGLTYEPTPAVVEQPAADLFDSASPTRRHLDRLTSPGGFQVADYREERDWDGAESYWAESGYAVFRLRDTLPHYFAARNAETGPRALRALTPVDGPGGYRVRCRKPDHRPLTRLIEESRILEHASALGGTIQVEIVGARLFLVRPGGFWPLDSPGFWARIDTIVEALSPFLQADDAPSAADGTAQPVP